VSKLVSTNISSSYHFNMHQAASSGGFKLWLGARSTVLSSPPPISWQLMNFPSILKICKSARRHDTINVEICTENQHFSSVSGGFASHIPYWTLLGTFVPSKPPDLAPIWKFLHPSLYGLCRRHSPMLSLRGQTP